MLSGGGRPNWLDRYIGTPATAQEDYSANRYWLNGRRYTDFAAWKAASSASFTRASVAYRWATGSILTPSVVDEARFEYDPVSLVALGLIIEGARTKINTYSEDFSSGWTLTGLTDTQSAVVGPDGSTKMRSLAEVASSSNHEATQALNILSGMTYGIQLIWKNNAGTRWIMPHFQNATARQHINAADGTLGAAANFSDISVRSAGSLKQFRATYASALSSSIGTGVRYKTTDNGASSYLGSPSNIIDFSAFNVEAGFPSSYMKTTSAAVTRAADVFTQPLSASVGGGIRVKARTAPGASGTQTLWQWDSGSDTSHRLVIYRDTSKHLHCAAYYGNVAQCNIDLGVVENSTDFTVDFRWDSYAAALNDTAAITSVGGLIPPFLTTQRRGGGVSAGSEWFGTIKSIARWDAVQYAARTIHGEGDSYMAGAGGVSMFETLAAEDSCQGIRTGIGGSTLQQALTRIQALGPKERNLDLIVWDGSPNGYNSTAEYLATFAAIAAAWGNGRFIFVPPVKRNANSSQEKTDIQTIRTAMLSTWPDNTVDAQQILADAGDPVGDATDILNDVVPTSLLQGDGTHLTQAGMDPVVAAVSALRTTNGW